MLAGVSCWQGFRAGLSGWALRGWLWEVEAMGDRIRPAGFVRRVCVCYLEVWATKLVHRHINFNFRKLNIWLLFRLMPSLCLFKVSALKLLQRGSHDAAQASNADKLDADSLKVCIRLIISFVV